MASAPAWEGTRQMDRQIGSNTNAGHTTGGRRATTGYKKKKKKKKKKESNGQQLVRSSGQQLDRIAGQKLSGGRVLSARTGNGLSPSRTCEGRKALAVWGAALRFTHPDRS